MGAAPALLDLLLVNVGNLPREPYYPYAFIMLSARARQRGLSVGRLDLSNLTEAALDASLTAALARSRPRMVGFTLRQTDTYDVRDYSLDPSLGYFPLEATRRAIATVRKATAAPIVAGGYGFTLHAAAVAPLLGVDYGIRGECDPLFDHFEDLLAGRDLARVPNLVHRVGDRFVLNEMRPYDPFPHPEYDDELITDFIQHYGNLLAFGRTHVALDAGRGPLEGTAVLAPIPRVPIEVSRGCCWRCSFCSEPLVKGRTVRYRPFEAIEEDLRRCLARGLRHFWFIGSELNHQGRAFGLALAERMLTLNEPRGADRFTWTSYLLPRWFSQDDMDLLYRSGFTTAWNPVDAFDDAQLKQSHSPYKAQDAALFLRRDAHARNRHGGLAPLPVSIFLGDRHLTPESLSRSVRFFHQERLREVVGGAVPVHALRVWDCEAQDVSEGEAVSFTPEGRGPVDLAHPTFWFSPELLRDFGGSEGVMAFHAHILSTFFSRDHRQRREWGRFLGRYGSPAALHRDLLRLGQGGRARPGPAPGAEDRVVTLEALLAAPSVAALRAFLSPPRHSQAEGDAEAERLLEWLGTAHRRELEPILAFLELPADVPGVLEWDEYDLHEHLYRRFATTPDLVAAVRKRFRLGPASTLLLLFRYLLHRRNVRLDPLQRKWIFWHLSPSALSQRDDASLGCRP